MDYISVGRCIMAIGPNDIASIEFLKNNNLALVASNENEVNSIVKQINGCHSTISEFANKNVEYSCSKLDGNKQRKDFWKDLYDISNKKVKI